MKQTIHNLMRSQMTSIINQWNDEGIIIETQFEFAWQHILQHHSKIVYEIITENGGHCVGGEYNGIISLAIEIPKEGWMYYFFDPMMVDCQTAKSMVIKYFEQRRH